MAEEGSEKKDHKYIARVELPNKTKKRKYRYFYTNLEYQAYLRMKKLMDQKKQQGIPKKYPLPNTKVAPKKYPLPNPNRKIGKEEMRKYVNEGKKAVDKIVKTETRPMSKLVKKFGEIGKKFVNSVKSIIDKVSSSIKYVKDYYDEKNYYKKSEKSKVEDMFRAMANNEPKKPKETYSYDENGVRLKTKDFTKDEDMAAINPNVHSGDEAYLTNCSYCTAAYDLRQRGYDVEAKPKDPNHVANIIEVASYYNDAKVEYVTNSLGIPITIVDEYTEPFFLRGDSPLASERLYTDVAKDLEEELESYGDGARGFLNLYWTNGGGHAVVWEIENGKTIIRDTQHNRVVSMEDYLSLCSGVNYFRTDNLEPSEKAFDLVKNRGE